jgi:hypothetical protein
MAKEKKPTKKERIEKAKELMQELKDLELMKEEIEQIQSGQRLPKGQSSCCGCFDNHEVDSS